MLGIGLDVNPIERGEWEIWIRLGHVGKINEGYLRETNFSFTISWTFYQLFCLNRTWARFDRFWA